VKHIIVIPYYCRKEIKTFIEIAKLWKRLTKTKINYEFLLSARYDIKPSKVLGKEFSKIAPTRSMQCVTKGSGRGSAKKGFIIEGPTAMFWDTMEYVYNNGYSQDGGFVLWFEADNVPLRSDWLDKLHEEWNGSNYLVMGRLIDRNWVAEYNPGWLPDIREHINGSACYSKDFCEKISKEKCDLRLSWDVEVFGQIKNKHKYKATDLIELRFCHPTITYPPHKETILLHGVKDTSALRYARKSNKIDITASLIQAYIYELIIAFLRAIYKFIKYQIKHHFPST